mmetsp:Transcript_2122/g.4353  ORF Transcript_2122/g.4353 Transcript_2122/m.4353 type:complete len:401 (-) Transcript_2122:380-1582(-)
MSDKAPVQSELAEKLSSIVPHLCDNTSLALQYFRAFLLTMSREWGGIDRHRMDKFMMLVRCFVKHSLEFLKKLKWHAQVLDEYMTIMMEIPFCWAVDKHAVGIQIHVSDIFFEELGKVVPFDEMNSDTIIRLAKPFLHCFKSCSEKVFLKRAEEAILHTLLRGWLEPKQEEVSEGQEFDKGSLQKRRGVCNSLRQALFDLASDRDTAEGNRDALYGIFDECRMVEGVLDDLLGSFANGSVEKDEEDIAEPEPVSTQSKKRKRKMKSLPPATEEDAPPQLISIDDDDTKVQKSEKKKKKKKSSPPTVDVSKLEKTPEATEKEDISSSETVYTPKRVLRERKLGKTSSATKGKGSKVAFSTVKLGSMNSLPEKVSQDIPSKSLLKPSPVVSPLKRTRRRVAK